MPIRSFEDLDEAIQKVPGKPTVLEALWDGDTQGWILFMDLYTEIEGAKEMHAEHLGIVVVPDRQLFSSAPRAPEAALAILIARQAVEKYGLTFYFPSDKEPDTDCPNWTQRHLAIECADCGKLIIPTDSPYLPKDICRSCHSIREHNEDLKENKPKNNAVFGIYQEQGSPVMHRDRTIHWFLLKHVPRPLSSNDISVTLFSNEELIALKNKIYPGIKERIAEYQPSTWTGEKRKFADFEIRSFEGKEYELAQQFHKTHIALGTLLRWYEIFEEAEKKGWTYYLHVVNNLRYRDDIFLRAIFFIDGSVGSFADKKPTSLTAFLARYQPGLTTDEIMETLKKLELMGAISIKEDEIRITEFGANLI